MKVYTYYEDIEFGGQNELIDLWKTSWQRNGFDAIVLNKVDVESHPYYTTFVERLNEMSNMVLNRDITKYDLSCYCRWLAYAGQKEELFFVSDYDVINTGLTVDKLPQPVDGEIHFMDDVCPCFASGKPSMFEYLCKDFINIFQEHFQLVDIDRHQEYNCFHDQDFLISFGEILQASNRYKITRNKDIINDYISDSKAARLVHVSHNYIYRLKKRHTSLKDIPLKDLRIQVINGLLDI